MFLTRLRNVLITALFVVLARSLVFICFEGSYFESDQAIIGLMAKHISELKVFPIYFYGQVYLFAISAWFTAPFFWVFEPSVFALKLPLLLLNCIIAATLINLFIRDCKLTPLQALLSTMFFCLPPVLGASRLVEAQGGNIEPFLFTILLWIFRDRGLLAGILMGVGLMNRPFALYGLISLVVLEFVNDPKFFIHQKNRFISFCISFGGTIVLIKFLARHVKNVQSGPDSMGRFHFNWIDIQWLFEHNLASLLGYRNAPLNQFAIQSGLSVGHAITAIVLGAMLFFSIHFIVRNRKVFKKSTEKTISRQFSIYLIITGVLSCFGYVLAAPIVRDHMLIRYNLLFYFFAIGFCAWVFQKMNVSQTLQKQKQIWSTLIILWCVPQAYDHLLLLHEYLYKTPKNPYRELANWLTDHKIETGLVPYWTSYHVSFLSQEKVKLQSSGQTRILNYFTHSPGQPYAIVSDAHSKAICNTPTIVGSWNVCIMNEKN